MVCIIFNKQTNIRDNKMQTIIYRKELIEWSVFFLITKNKNFLLHDGLSKNHSVHFISEPLDDLLLLLLLNSLGFCSQFIFPSTMNSFFGVCSSGIYISSTGHQLQSSNGMFPCYIWIQTYSVCVCVSISVGIHALNYFEYLG